MYSNLHSTRYPEEEQLNEMPLEQLSEYMRRALLDRAHAEEIEYREFQKLSREEQDKQRNQRGKDHLDAALLHSYRLLQDFLDSLLDLRSLSSLRDICQCRPSFHQSQCYHHRHRRLTFLVKRNERESIRAAKRLRNCSALLGSQLPYVQVLQPQRQLLDGASDTE